MLSTPVSRISQAGLTLWTGTTTTVAERAARRLLADQPAEALPPISLRCSPRRLAEIRISRALALQTVRHQFGWQGCGRWYDLPHCYSHTFADRFSDRFASDSTESPAAIGVALGQEGGNASISPGLDMEWMIRHSQRPMAVAERTFSPTETDLLRRVDKAHRPLWFRYLWTLREALAKAMNLGLAQARRRLALVLEEGHLQLRLDGQRAPHWHWRHYRPQPDLLLALVWLEYAGQSDQPWQLLIADEDLQLSAADWPQQPMPALSTIC